MNIQRYRGDTYSIKRQLVDDLNQPIDITSDTFVLSVSKKENPLTASYLYQETATITDAANGKFEFSMLNNADYIGSFFYDIEQQNGSIIRTLEKGSIQYIQDIGK